MKIRLFVFGAALFALALSGAFGWSSYDANNINMGNATIGNTLDQAPNGGATEMAMSLVGVYSAGKSRTALDLRPPSQVWGTSGITEYVLYGEGDGSENYEYSRLNVGWGSYLSGFYSIAEESGAGRDARPITIGIADHHNGWNRDAIRIIESNGSVIMGAFAQKNSESEVDYDPIDMLTLQAPALVSAGYKDSHAFVLSGRAYNNASHNADWRMKANVTSQAAASTFLLQNRIDGAAYATALSITDGGGTDLNGLFRPMSKTASYPSTGKGLEVYYDSGGDMGVIESCDRTGALTRKALVVSGTPTYFCEGGTTVMTVATSGKVGVGTTSPGSKLQVAGGDLSVSTQGNGLILKATNGASCYRITVNNSGTLSTASVTCP